MEGIVATDATPESAPKASAATPLLETWSQNAPMRHVPTLGWILEKLDRDVRRRIELLVAPVELLNSDDPRRVAAEDALRGVCRALDCMAELAKHSKGNHPPASMTSRATWALNNALASLRTLDADLFSRRYPVQTHERSKAEPIYGTLLSALSHLDRVLDAVRKIDPTLDEKLLTGLVNLVEPLRSEPIA